MNAQPADADLYLLDAALRPPGGFAARLVHAARAVRAVAQRDAGKLLRQRGRLLASLVRPALWLFVFAAGFHNVFGVSIIPPYETYVVYQEYVVPGLLGIVLLFNGMQSSLSMVYDREMGMMRLLLTAPLPRPFLLFAKLASGALLGVLQAYAFLLLCLLLDIAIPWSGWLLLAPAMLLAAFMLGGLGLLLSLAIRQIENFAGMMNFVIFPMFFLSSALYPLWRLRENAPAVVGWLAACNPFTFAVELIRFAAYGRVEPTAAVVVTGCAVAFFGLACLGYAPRRRRGD